MKLDILITDYRKTDLDGAWESYLPYLTEAERLKALRYKMEPDRIRSVAGALLIREAMRRAGLAGAGERPEPVFGEGEYGKPFLTGAEGFEFNLSHSGDLIVLAFNTGGMPVGIDVEKVKEGRSRSLGRFFSEEEYERIESSSDPWGEFYSLWTVHEAFSKEEGKGLSILDEEFRIDHDAGKVYYNGRILYFRALSRPGYRITVCAPRVFEPAEEEVRSFAGK